MDSANLDEGSQRIAGTEPGKPTDQNRVFISHDTLIFTIDEQSSVAAVERDRLPSRVNQSDRLIAGKTGRREIEYCEVGHQRFGRQSETYTAGEFQFERFRLC
jgi:hypothetical protein